MKANKQKGIVLIMVLSLLLALTVLGVSSMSSSTLETRMANNFQDRNKAFQAAEAALREGERLIESSNFTGSEFDNQCTGGLCECTQLSTCDYAGSSTEGFWEIDAIWSTASKHKTYSISNIVTSVSAPAKYIIENLGETCPDDDPSCDTTTTVNPSMYRVTAIGYGSSLNAKVMLQSTYKK